MQDLMGSRGKGGGKGSVKSPITASGLMTGGKPAGGTSGAARGMGAKKIFGKRKMGSRR